MRIFFFYEMGMDLANVYLKGKKPFEVLLSLSDFWERRRLFSCITLIVVC